MQKILLVLLFMSSYEATAQSFFCDQIACGYTRDINGHFYFDSNGYRYRLYGRTSIRVANNTHYCFQAEFRQDNSIYACAIESEGHGYEDGGEFACDQKLCGTTYRDWDGAAMLRATNGRSYYLYNTGNSLYVDKYYCFAGEVTHTNYYKVCSILP